jgi:DNA invertase Pin-like site-specific DNA recombinase
VTQKPRKQLVRAYSYVRFSTEEQAKGDSLRRQTEAAQKYAAAHGMELDKELKLSDLGVSAFRGKNADTGALGGFQRAIEDGTVEPGAILIVESLDRVSRQAARKAVRILEDIVDLGVDVVTLDTNTRYTKASLNGIDFLVAILHLMRAHGESERKSGLLKAAWSNKRSKAVADRTVMTKLVPTWMTLDAKRRPVLVPERAATVRLMVRMKLKGAGYMAIAAHLNREGVAPFRRAAQWQKSIVHKILTSPALVGTFTPSIREHKDGKLLLHAQEPIPNYFPPVISEDTFSRLQQTLSAPQARGRHAKRGAASILAGLARCPECDSIMTRVRGGRANKFYLVCTKVRAGAAKHGQRVRYEHLETVFIEQHRAVLAQMPSPNDEVVRGLANADAAVNALEGRMEALLEQLDRNPSDALAKRVAQLEATLKGAQADLSDWQDKAAATDSKAIKLRRANLMAAIQARPKDVARINAALRELATEVVIDYRTGHLVFKWRSGGESSLLFMLPKEST